MNGGRSSSFRSSFRRAEAGGVLFKLIVIMVLLTALVVLGWMLLLPSLARKAVQGGSDFTTQLDRLAANPFTGSFQGGDLYLRNPARFGGDVFADVAEFDGVVQVRSVTRSELVIETLTLDITKLVLVVDAEGKSNLNAFGESFAAIPAAEIPRYAVAGLPVIGDGPSQVLIRRLELKLGRLEVLDLAGAQPVRVGDDLNYTHTYENVRSVEQLFTPDLLGRLLKSPQLWQALVSSGAVPGLDRGDNPLHNLMEQGKDLLNSLFRKLEQTGKP
jgi:hypothetical protein